MTSFPVIDRAIPLPTQPLRRLCHGFGALDVGDSIFVSPADKKRTLGALRVYRQRYPGWDYTFAAENEGIRVWRTA